MTRRQFQFSMSGISALPVHSYPVSLYVLLCFDGSVGQSKPFDSDKIRSRFGPTQKEKIHEM